MEFLLEDVTYYVWDMSKMYAGVFVSKFSK